MTNTFYAYSKLNRLVRERKEIQITNYSIRYTSNFQNAVTRKKSRYQMRVECLIYSWGFPPASLGGGASPPKFWGYSIEMESAPSQFPGSAFAEPPQSPPKY